MLAAARLLWEERACDGVLRVADRSTQLSERCVARAACRGACYISRLERQAGGDAAAPVIELRTAPFRCHFETASGQLAKWF